MIRAGQARTARKRYLEMAPVLNEQSRRRFVALEAQALGRGGVSLMARISGLARSTIYHGLSDIRRKISAPSGRIRNRGGGRKKKAFEDPTLAADLKELGRDPERRIFAAAVIVGVEQDDAAVVDQLEIGEADPADRARVRVARKGAGRRRPAARTPAPAMARQTPGRRHHAAAMTARRSARETQRARQDQAGSR
jgi:hypothetical protein